MCSAGIDLFYRFKIPTNNRVTIYGRTITKFLSSAFLGPQVVYIRLRIPISI